MGREQQKAQQFPQIDTPVRPRHFSLTRLIEVLVDLLHPSLCNLVSSAGKHNHDLENGLDAPVDSGSRQGVDFGQYPLGDTALQVKTFKDSPIWPFLGFTPGQ